jgi:hypothetical protein
MESNSVCGRGFEGGVAPLFIDGLKYHTDSTIRNKESVKGIGSLLNYHTSTTSVEALIESMKKMCPRFTPDSVEGLAFLAVHPALTEEEREKYRILFYQKHEEECKIQEQELIQTRKSCQSPVNQQQSNTTEPFSPISDMV